MKKFYKIAAIIVGILIAIISCLFLFMHVAFDGIMTGPSYDKKDLLANYELLKEEIIDAKTYFESIVPEDALVTIEFENDNELSIFHVITNNEHTSNWNLKVNSPKVDSLLSELNWTVKELRTLKDKLDKANCISIGGKEPVIIGWQRSGMGMFSYNIFEENLSPEKIAKYNDGCIYIYYKDNVVLEYGGGAIGLQCFPGHH